MSYKPSKNATRILEYLKYKGIEEAKDIEKELKIGRNNANRYLKELRNAKKIHKIPLLTNEYYLYIIVRYYRKLKKNKIGLLKKVSIPKNITYGYQYKKETEKFITDEEEMKRFKEQIERLKKEKHNIQVLKYFEKELIKEKKKSGHLTDIQLLNRVSEKIQKKFKK